MSDNAPPPTGGSSGGYESTPPPPPPPGAPGGYYGGPPAASPPPNHLVWAILSTLFCCLPLGIASIVFAAQVNSKYAAGDYAGAQESSRKARQFALWGTIAGAVIIVLYVIGIVAFGLSLGSTSTDTSGY